VVSRITVHLKKYLTFTVTVSIRRFKRSQKESDTFEILRDVKNRKDSTGVTLIALRATSYGVWPLYSDLHRHKLTRRYEPNAETRAMLERCVLFLDSSLELEWPVPTLGLANILSNLLSRAKLLMGLSSGSEGNTPLDCITMSAP
jgi:hypothetical protein